MLTHPLRAYRVRAGISMEALAWRVQVSKASISRIETGLQSPSPELARALEAETGVPKWQLRPDIWDKPRAATDRKGVSGGRQA
jgi:transcriptional regulator with XRE-family HTH domain